MLLVCLHKEGKLDWKWSSQDLNQCLYAMMALRAVSLCAVPQCQLPKLKFFIYFVLLRSLFVSFISKINEFIGNVQLYVLMSYLQFLFLFCKWYCTLKNIIRGPGSVFLIWTMGIEMLKNPCKCSGKSLWNHFQKVICYNDSSETSKLQGNFKSNSEYFRKK